MKKSFPASGSARWVSLASMGVGWPKYTRHRSPMMASPSQTERTRMAESSSKKDTTMRRNDLSGAQA